MLEKAIATDPTVPTGYLNVLGTACTESGHLTDAVETYQSVFDRNPSHQESTWAHLGLTFLYVELGQETEARAEAAEVLKLVPNFSVEIWGQRFPIRDHRSIEKYLAALRTAGLT